MVTEEVTRYQPARMLTHMELPTPVQMHIEQQTCKTKQQHKIILYTKAWPGFLDGHLAVLEK